LGLKVPVISALVLLLEVLEEWLSNQGKSFYLFVLERRKMRSSFGRYMKRRNVKVQCGSYEQLL
jgi:hypothetical protein